MTQWKHLVPAAVFGLVVGLTAEGAQAQPLELQFGTTSPPGNMQSLSAENFAERVNEQLDGTATVTVYTDSQLGSDREMLQKLKLGTQDMSQPSTIMSTIVRPALPGSVA